MDYLILTGFPLPHSVNNSLQRSRSARRFIKTPEARAYDREVEAWERIKRLKYRPGQTTQGPDFDQRVEIIKQWVNQGYQLKADYYFLFHVERLIWKNKQTLRVIDTDNRIKPLQDALSEVVQVEDHHIISGHRERIATHNKEDECAIIVISRTKLKVSSGMIDTKELYQMSIPINQENALVI